MLTCAPSPPIGESTGMLEPTYGIITPESIKSDKIPHDSLIHLASLILSCLSVLSIPIFPSIQSCSSVISYPAPDSVLLGSDRNFTFDYVKGEHVAQVCCCSIRHDTNSIKDRFDAIFSFSTETPLRHHSFLVTIVYSLTHSSTILNIHPFVDSSPLCMMTVWHHKWPPSWMAIMLRLSLMVKQAGMLSINITTLPTTDDDMFIPISTYSSFCSSPVLAHSYYLRSPTSRPLSLLPFTSLPSSVVRHLPWVQVVVSMSPWIN